MRQVGLYQQLSVVLVQTTKYMTRFPVPHRYLPDGRNSYCQADRRTDQNTKRRSEKLHAQYFPGMGIESCAPPDLDNRPVRPLPHHIPQTPTPCECNG
jgi:hypothetical protein